jgi:type II secretory pathway pseudopilin PulG
MKHLILAAGFALIAAPAFAGSAHDADGTAAQQAAMATTAQQQHTYSYNSDEGSSSAIETRNARLQRNAAERSPNAKAAWAGQAHFY